MDINDIQNLQEAYNQMYQVDEAKQESEEEDWRKSEIRNLRRHRQTGTRTPYTDRIVSHAKGRGVKKERGSKVQREETEISEAEKWIQKAIKKPGALSKQLGVPEDENIPAGKLAAAAKKGGKLGKRARLAMTLKGLRREEIDLYDIVFSHLLDEGYAANEEAAVAIMANMSEEWRDSIIEATGMFGTPRVPDIISGKASAANTIKAPSNVKPLPSIKSPFSKPASTTDSGKLTTYGAGGGAAAERAGQTRAQVMQQGAKNLETKNRNPGPNFGR